MKPDWKDAPEWANYLAMDTDKRWFWYENEPELCRYGWNPANGRMQEAVQGASLWDIKQTLEERP